MASIFGSGKKDKLTGSNLADTLFGLGGDDQLFGKAGNDTLYGGDGNDLLDGGKGADKMLGGKGNDTYIVDNAADKAVEKAGQGTDTVKSSVSWALGLNVENLQLTGGAAINGTGNGGDNTITGNAAANTLSGGDGNDTITGGAGADHVLGGNGNDTVIANLSGDTLEGGIGHDTLSYRDSAEGVFIDVRSGTTATNTLGAPTIDTFSGFEVFEGSAHADLIVLNNTGTVLLAAGGAGNDDIISHIAGSGQGGDLNEMRGDDGNDHLEGGFNGGGLDNRDRFILQYNRGADFITFFDPGNDKFVLSKSEFHLASPAGGSLLVSELGSSAIANSPDNRLMYDTISHILWADLDGNGDNFASIAIAFLTFVPTANDFIVV